MAATRKLRRLRAGSRAARVLARLRLSPVPVRTSVLVEQCGVGDRGQVWGLLLRLERRGEVRRQTRRAEWEPCVCPHCGHARPVHRNHNTESFWMATH